MEPLPLEAYQSALENTVDAVVITDLHSVIQYVNPAFTAITGYTREEVIGGKPSIVRSRHTTAETYREMWSVILAGGWWRGELINVKKSGEEWYSWVSISQIRDGSGKPFAYIGVSRDITELKRLQAQLKEASLEAIFMLSVACEAKDEVTGNHIRRVQHMSQALARKMGYSEAEAEEIGFSSMMHDIGKLHVPDAILKKAGPLTRAEWEEMTQHPAKGAAILRDKPFYEVARQIAAGHHEKWNGVGYPQGVADTYIPLAARIVTVVDVYDALTSARPYKPAWTEEAAIEELKDKRGQSFDPDVVDAFLGLCEEGVVHRIREAFP